MVSVYLYKTPVWTLGCGYVLGLYGLYSKLKMLAALNNNVTHAKRRVSGTG